MKEISHTIELCGALNSFKSTATHTHAIRCIRDFNELNEKNINFNRIHRCSRNSLKNDPKAVRIRRLWNHQWFINWFADYFQTYHHSDDTITDLDDVVAECKNAIKKIEVRCMFLLSVYRLKKKIRIPSTSAYQQITKNNLTNNLLN